MTDLPHDHQNPRCSRLDEAVRKATPLKRMAKPTRRSLLRVMSVYANVFAILVSLGIPNGTLRHAAFGALSSFDGAVRQTSADVIYAMSADYSRGASEVWTDFAEYIAADPVVDTSTQPTQSQSVPTSEPPAKSADVVSLPVSESEPVMSPSAFPDCHIPTGS